MPQRGMEMETEPSKDFTLSPPSQQQQHDEQEGNIEASLDVIKAGDNVKYSQQQIVNPPQEKMLKTLLHKLLPRIQVHEGVKKNLFLLSSFSTTFQAFEDPRI